MELCGSETREMFKRYCIRTRPRSPLRSGGATGK